MTYVTFLRFCRWMKRTEHMIGQSTGMNPAYLSTLRREIDEIDKLLFLKEASWS